MQWFLPPRNEFSFKNKFLDISPGLRAKPQSSVKQFGVVIFILFLPCVLQYVIRDPVLRTDRYLLMTENKRKRNVSSKSFYWGAHSYFSLYSYLYFKMTPSLKMCFRTSPGKSTMTLSSRFLFEKLKLHCMLPLTSLQCSAAR